MSDLVDAGCHLLIWLGMLDPSSCARSPESQSPLWLKMIAGPTLVITILILVLFEDLYVRPKMRLPLGSSAAAAAAARSRRRYQNRRPGSFIQAESASDRVQPLLDRDKIRLVICDQTADQNEICYRVLKSCPLRQLLQFHYRSLGRALSDDDVGQYVVRRLAASEAPLDSHQKPPPRLIQYQHLPDGALNLDKTARQLSLQDLDRLDLQLDYKSLCDSFANVLWKATVRFVQELNEERAQNRDLNTRLRSLSDRLGESLSLQAVDKKTIKEQKLEIAHLQECRQAAKEARANLARSEVLYALESSSRTRVQKELQVLHHQLFETVSAMQQNQKAFDDELSSRLAQMDELRSQLDALTLDREHLLQQTASLKADKEKAIRQLVARKDDLKALGKQLADAQSVNDKMAAELNDARLAIRHLEMTNSNLQLQLHEQRKDGETRPGALIRRPDTAPKKMANAVAGAVDDDAFVSGPPPCDWIRAAARSLPGIQAPLLIIDDGGKSAADDRMPFHHPLESKAHWRYS